MTSGINPSSENLLGLRWLVRLRWIAVCGQVVISLVTAIGFSIRLPEVLLACCIGITVASNILLERYLRSHGGGTPVIKALVLSVDVVVLTVMLFFTGGAHNPFTMFYLLHVTMAVILLPPWGAWGTVVLCTVGFWTLFYSDHALVSSKGETCCSDMNAHLQGMVVGMVLTGCGIAYFVSRLTAGLRESRRMVAMAQVDGERARRTMEVATLAAGIAHELATPLGTIAVVSQDLERMAGECCAAQSCAADARVIRQEVERCRRVIEKLGKAGTAPEETIIPLDWDNLAALISGYLSEPVRERLDVKVRPSSSRPLVPQSRLFQCLAILVKNATEAAPTDTRVVLDAAIIGNRCVFRVLDRGPGFPEGFGKRLGEPLFTTKAKNGGLGLGLYLVKTFVTDLQGGLQVESGAGGETIVEMQLPLVEHPS
jgi:two-component system sensor histidine kinase RegB